MSLNNTQYDTLIRQYNATQLQNQRIRQQRLEETYEKSPALKELDASISRISVSQARKMLDGDESALADLKNQLALLKEKRKALLTELDLPADYFETPYHCPDCRDTGYVGNQRCHCFKQAAIDMIYTQSNIKDILAKENFSHFSFDYYPKDDLNPSTGLSSYETARRAVTVAKDFTKNFDKRFQNLFFYGDTGVGKTFLSNCIAKELLDQGHSVIYFTAFELFEIFSKNVFEKDRDAIRANQNIFDCDLLIIDDLGTEVGSSFTSSQFFLCINERILREKSTIISTNLRPNQLTDADRKSTRLNSSHL